PRLSGARWDRSAGRAPGRWGGPEPGRSAGRAPDRRAGRAPDRSADPGSGRGPDVEPGRGSRAAGKPCGTPWGADGMATLADAPVRRGEAPARRPGRGVTMLRRRSPPRFRMKAQLPDPPAAA